MAAHPVKMIGVKQLLADHDRAHLEQARDEPAPCRQQKERHEPRSFRHLIIGHCSLVMHGLGRGEGIHRTGEGSLDCRAEAIYFYSETLAWQVRAIVRILFRWERNDGMPEMVVGKPAGLKMSRWRWWLAIFLAAGLVWGGWVWWTDRNYRDAILQIELEMANRRFATAARSLTTLLTRWPDCGEAAILLARCEQERGRNEAAAKALARVEPGYRVFAQSDPGSNAPCTRPRATRRRRADRQRRRGGSAK